MPKRERYVWVCTNRRPDGHPKGSCAASGSEDFHRELKAAVGKAGLADRVRVMTGSCEDLCWVGTVAAVMPDHVFLKQLTSGDVPRVVAALGDATAFASQEAIADKLVQPDEFDEAKPLVALGRGPR